MEYARDMHGMCLEYAGNIDGTRGEHVILSMEYAWKMRGVCSEYACNMHGTRVEYGRTCNMNSICKNIHGTCMAYEWNDGNMH